MKAQVLTITASACSGSATIRKPEADSRPATFSESTSLRPHPSVTTATVGGPSWSRIIDLLSQVVTVPREVTMTLPGLPEPVTGLSTPPGPGPGAMPIGGDHPAAADPQVRRSLSEQPEGASTRQPVSPAARQPELGPVESVEDPFGVPSAELATASALLTVKERCQTRPLRSGTPSDRPLTVSSTTDGAPSVRSMLRLALNVRRSDVPRTPWKETLPSAVTLVHEGPR